MIYMLLIYCDESDWVNDPPEAIRTTLEGHRSLEEELRGAGRFRGGGGLGLVSSARTVRFRGGQPSVIDGPFAETKEQLGGFYLVEADGIEEAVAVARRIPGIPDRAIEVRPVLHHSAA